MKLRDHLCIKGTVPVTDFNEAVGDVSTILEKLQGAGLIPLYDEELGYYAEHAKHLVSNLFVQLTLRLESEYKQPLVDSLSKLGYKVQSKIKASEDGKGEVCVAIEGPALFNDQISFINAVVDFINSQDVASPMGMDDDDKPKHKHSEELTE